MLPKGEVTFEIHGNEARRVGDVSAQSLSFTKHDIALDVTRWRLWIVWQRRILQTETAKITKSTRIHSAPSTEKWEWDAAVREVLGNVIIEPETSNLKSNLNGQQERKINWQLRVHNTIIIHVGRMQIIKNSFYKLLRCTNTLLTADL